MGDDGKAMYYRYGRKKTYIFQGFVRSEGYEKNKIYRFIVNEELFNLIKSFLTNDEIDTIPTDREKGLDFILNVTGKIANINGKPQEVKDYSTSKWSSNETPLTDAENAWLAENKPFVSSVYPAISFCPWSIIGYNPLSLYSLVGSFRPSFVTS